MINEQREAIKILKEIQESNRAWLMQTKEENCEKIYLKDIEAIDTVLSLIKEQEEKIDLMAECMSKQDIEEDICMKNRINADLCNENYTNCKDCIKQYFENKVNSSEQK